MRFCAKHLGLFIAFIFFGFFISPMDIINNPTGFMHNHYPDGIVTQIANHGVGHFDNAINQGSNDVSNHFENFANNQINKVEAQADQNNQ